MGHPLSFQCLLLISFIFSSYLTATQSSMIPRLNPIGELALQEAAALAANDIKDFKTSYYQQTLDHFNYRPESYTKFPQRYLINFNYWDEANSSAPIFVYLGAEAPIDGDLKTIGFLTDNAASFKALIVYIEHRYYGKSVPFGSWEEALKDAKTKGYFNSAQALADYAAVLIHIKKTLNAQKSPVIVVGGSYGGMLASWFRLKYPHLALGALASSAPVLYFDNITPSNAYYSVVTRDFREVSETCYETILKSWSEIDKVASEPDGLSILTHRFNACSPLNQTSELMTFLDNMYSSAAQYNLNQPPRYPVNLICGAIDKASSGSDILSKIRAAVVAYKGNTECSVMPFELTETSVGWSWQTCSEMVMPIGRENDTMFPPNPFHLKSFMKSCKEEYGVSPRPHWVTAYYGGHDMKLILQRFGSNIIFSNGLHDPYSSAGVLENISDSVVAVYTVEGTHCLDLLHAKSSDPEWLVKQRKEEIKIIKGWITQYYADLHASKKS